MADMRNITKINQCVTFRDSQGNEKMQFLLLLLFCLDFLIRNENISSDECKTKSRLK